MNLLQPLFGTFSNDRLSKLAYLLGERPAAVQKGVGAALSAIVAGAASRGSTPDGAAALMAFMEQNRDNLERVRSVDATLQVGPGLESASECGGAILRTLFGSRVLEVAEAVRRFAGLQGNGTTLLMGLAAPVVVNHLSRATSASGTTPQGLSTLLTGQITCLKSLTPTGLRRTLSTFPGLAELWPRPAQVMGEISSQSSSVRVTPISNAGASRFAYSGATRRREPVERKGPGWLQWLLMAGLGAFFLVLGLKSCESTVNREIVFEPGGAPKSDAIASAPNAVVDAAVDASPVLATENLNMDLYRYLQSDAPAPRNFVLRGVTFQTASANLTRAGRETLNAVSRTLIAFPNAQVRIEGHTDNQGEYDANLRLSKARAESVLAYLVALNVPTSQMSALGYGPDSPVADNRTTEGRQSNRRVQMQVLAK